MRIYIILIFILFGEVKLLANQLSKEESPYLQQHSKNPVEWYAWNKEAFKRAKDENKLIFLSIGYSTCHWCHVMEKESFEDKEIADILNENFISIKVDREEYPQIDRYYQLVHQVVNGGGGGWPLTIIMTPDKEPLFAGTYIPKNSKFSRNGLKDILNFIVKEWEKNPKRVKDIAHKIKLNADEMSYQSLKLIPKKPDENISKIFVDELEKGFDKEYGGWGGRIKFPQANRILTLIDIYLITKNQKALEMVEKSLNVMALSGLYDQIEGGFFRYSTDREWRIPHFEKMLYTNAELIEVYSRAWEITKNPLYKRVVKDTIEVFLNRYRDKSTLFYGASDADSKNKKGEGEEGYYFTYGYDEVKNFLKDKSIDENLIKRGLKHYGITKDGNFVNFRNNTHIADAQGSFLVIKDVLKEIRQTREYPFIDKKMLASWNGLMIHSLFIASKIDNSYAVIAKESLDSLINKLYIKGILYHQTLPKKEPKIKGSLEDYTFVIEALIDAYDYSLDEKYLSSAKELLLKAEELFFDKDKGFWLDSRSEISNPLSIEDDAYKSTLAILIFNYLRLATLDENPKYYKSAKETLYHFFEEIQKYSISSATAVRVTLAYTYGYILLKSQEDDLPKLKKLVTDEILYPFIEYKVVKDRDFQACKIDRCFIHEKDIKDFVNKLKNIIK